MFTGPKIITDGLVLHLDAATTRSYPGSGTTWTDLSPSNNNGELIGGPTYNSGKIVFDGIDDYININNNSSLELNNFTLEAWVYPINNSEQSHIIRKEGSYILSHYWSSSNKLGVWVQRTGGWESTHANITVPLNKWCHIVGTYNNTNVIIYYNGEQVASTAKTGSIRVTSNNVLINGQLKLNPKVNSFNLVC